jgi:hypothetical protein
MNNEHILDENVGGLRYQTGLVCSFEEKHIVGGMAQPKCSGMQYSFAEYRRLKPLQKM